MADAPKILGTDSLRQAYPKLNSAIDNSNLANKTALAADVNSSKAIEKANEANAKSDSTQTQLNNIIIESGTSDAEVIQARGNATVLNERLNDFDKRFEDIAVNAKNFGAKGDGIFDNTFVVQTAIESSINKILFFPAGNYNFTTGNIYINNINRENGNRVHIRGEKGTKFIYTKEDKTHTSYVDVPDANCIFDIVNFDTVIFENIELEGNTTYENITGDNTDESGYWGAVWGVKVRKNKNLHFDNVNVHGFNYRGISVNDDSDTLVDITDYMHVNNCKGHHNRGSGFWVNNVDKLFIKNSEFFNDGLKGTIQTGYGFACSTKVNNCFVDNCYFHHSWGKGLDSHGFGNLTVRNCTFEDMGKACVGWGYPSAYLNECHIVIENNTFISGFTSEGEQWLRELHQANAANGFYNRQGMLHCRGNAKINAVIEVKNNTFLGCYTGWDVPVQEGNSTISDNRIIMLGEDDDTGAKGWAQVVIEGNTIRGDKYRPYSTGSSRGAEMLYLGKNVTEATIRGNHIIKLTGYRMSDGTPGFVIRSYYNKSDSMMKILFYDNTITLLEGYIFQVDNSRVSLKVANNNIEVTVLDNVRNENSPYFNDFGKYGLRRSNTEFINNKMLLANRKLSFSEVKLVPFSVIGAYTLNTFIDSLIDYGFANKKYFQISQTGGTAAGGTVGYVYLDNVGLFDLKVTLKEGMYSSAMTSSTAEVSASSTSLTTSTTFNKVVESARFDVISQLVEFGNIRLVEVRIVAKTSLPADLVLNVEYAPRLYNSFGILSFSKSRTTSF